MKKPSLWFRFRYWLASVIDPEWRDPDDGVWDGWWRDSGQINGLSPIVPEIKPNGIGPRLIWDFGHLHQEELMQLTAEGEVPGVCKAKDYKPWQEGEPQESGSWDVVNNDDICIGKLARLYAEPMDMGDFIYTDGIIGQPFEITDLPENIVPVHGVKFTDYKDEDES